MQFCPNCGYDLDSEQPVEFGNVTLNEFGELIYEGEILVLPRSQYTIANALIRAKGRGVSLGVLAERIGGEVFDQTIVKYIARLRSSLKMIDPNFDQIVSLRGFSAYRWAERPHTLIREHSNIN